MATSDATAQKDEPIIRPRDTEGDYGKFGRSSETARCQKKGGFHKRTVTWGNTSSLRELAG